MSFFSRRHPDPDRPSEIAITTLVQVLQTDTAFDDLSAQQRRQTAVELLRVKRAAEEGRFDDDR